MPVKIPVTFYCKKYLLYSLLSLLSLLFINKIDETNGMPILKLLKSNSHDKIINNNNINNININININKINDTNNDEIIKPKLYNNNNDDTIKTKINNNYNNEIERIKTTEVLDKNYTINGTIIKQSIIYDDTINNFIGEVLIYYNNTYHNHHYCKIHIIIPNQLNASYIHKYIYYYYDFNKKIKLICNYYDCLELFKYNKNTNQNVYYKCTILDTIKLKDEL